MNPITPQEALNNKNLRIPAEVIEVFNEEIIANIKLSGHATIVQDKIIPKILERFKSNGKEVSPHDLFERGWLDVEPIFRGAGWVVEYDKPGFHETGPATFKFSKK